MASRHRLEVIGGGDPIDVDERSHLLAVLQRAEVPIRTSCGGVATCGLCRLTVVEGGEHLTPLREVEVHHLGNVAPILGLRLACQARFAEPGVVRVEVPPPPEDVRLRRQRQQERVRAPREEVGEKARSGRPPVPRVEWRPRKLEPGALSIEEAPARAPRRRP